MEGSFYKSVRIIIGDVANESLNKMRHALSFCACRQFESVCELYNNHRCLANIANRKVSVLFIRDKLDTIPQGDKSLSWSERVSSQETLTRALRTLPNEKIVLGSV